jgi:hypothetical protein
LAFVFCIAFGPLLANLWVIWAILTCTQMYATQKKLIKNLSNALSSELNQHILLVRASCDLSCLFISIG